MSLVFSSFSLPCVLSLLIILYCFVDALGTHCFVVWPLVGVLVFGWCLSCYFSVVVVLSEKTVTVCFFLHMATVACHHSCCGACGGLHERTYTFTKYGTSP